MVTGGRFHSCKGKKCPLGIIATRRHLETSYLAKTLSDIDSEIAFCEIEDYYNEGGDT